MQSDQVISYDVLVWFEAAKGQPDANGSWTSVASCQQKADAKLIRKAWRRGESNRAVRIRPVTFDVMETEIAAVERDVFGDLSPSSFAGAVWPNQAAYNELHDIAEF